MYAKHFADTYAGMVFSQCMSPVGVAIPLYTGTDATGGLPILNPSGSGVVIELLRYDICYSSGTAAFTSIGLMSGSCAGIGSATGCSAFASTVPVNGGTLIQTGGSKVMSSNGGTVTVTAGTATPGVPGIPGAGWARTICDLNLEAQTGTVHATGMHTYDFDGSVVIGPGTIIYLAGKLASVSLYASCVVWKEIPTR